MLYYDASNEGVLREIILDYIFEVFCGDCECTRTTFGQTECASLDPENVESPECYKHVSWQNICDELDNFLKSIRDDWLYDIPNLQHLRR